MTTTPWVDRQERVFDKPFVVILNPELTAKFCSNCLQHPGNDGKLLRCGKCFLQQYCNRDCQLAAWHDHHRFECALFAVAPNGDKRTLPHVEVLIFLRLLAKLRPKAAGKKYEESLLPEVVKRRTFETLLSHSEEIRKDDEKIHYFGIMVNQIRDLLATKGLKLEVLLTEIVGHQKLNGFHAEHIECTSPPSENPLHEALLTVFGKKIINSHGISDNKGQQIGQAVDLYVSAYDHSCRPNIAVVYKGYTTKFRALEPTLDVYDTAKAFTSYVELMATRRTRQAELARNYYFVCECARCVDPDDDKLSSIRCENSVCLSPIVIDEVAIPTGEILCADCAMVVPLERIIEGQYAMEAARKWMATTLPTLERFTALERLLEQIEKYERILHPLNVYFAELCTHALQYGVWTKQHLRAVARWGAIATDCLRLCYPPMFKNLGFHYLKLAYANILLRKYADALPLVVDGWRIFKVYFGEEHNFTFKVAQLRTLLSQSCVDELFAPDDLLKYLKL